MSEMNWDDGPEVHVCTVPGKTGRVLWCDTCNAFVEVSGDRAACPACGSPILTCVCTRCLHEWRLRRSIVPKVCPSCKSPYWMRLKKGQTAEGVRKAYLKRRGSA